MNRILKCKIVEFAPGKFHVYSRPGWFWSKSRRMELFGPVPVMFRFKEAAESYVMKLQTVHEQRWLQQQHIPRTWEYPPNKVQKDLTAV